MIAPYRRANIVGKNLLRNQKKSGEIDPQDLLPGVEWILGDGDAGTEQAGVVDQHIDPAELRQRRADDALGVRRVTDIAGCTGDHAATGADRRHRFVELDAITRTDKNFGARRGISRSDCAADAAAAARNQRNFVAQFFFSAACHRFFHIP